MFFYFVLFFPNYSCSEQVYVQWVSLFHLMIPIFFSSLLSLWDLCLLSLMSALLGGNHVCKLIRVKCNETYSLKHFYAKMLTYL